MDDHVPPRIGEALADLAACIRALDDELLDPGSTRARELALHAAAVGTDLLEETGSLSISVIVGQVRSTATDMLRALGVERTAARDAVISAGAGGTSGG